MEQFNYLIVACNHCKIASVSESFKVTDGKGLGLLQTMKSEVPPGQTDRNCNKEYD